MQCPYLALILWAAGWSCVSHARQNGRLFYYETLSSISVKTRTKRSSGTKSKLGLVKELQFNVFQRSFHLSLTPGSSILARGFRARMIHGDGSATWFSPDQSKIFTGHVVSSPKSFVSAHLEGDLWNIHILERGETYAVEPAWRLLSQGENRRNDTMVSYRLSDVKDLPNKSRFCSAVPELNTSRENRDLHLHQPRRRLRHSRKKRYIKDTCVLNIVIDAFLFQHKCRRDHLACAALTIRQIEVADKLFRSSKFESSLGSYKTGIGLQVGKLTMYTDHTTEVLGSNREHFNSKKKFNAPLKFELFAEAMAQVRTPYCLHHLFSEFQDPHAILGRAFTNVLCESYSYRNMATNVAISSATDDLGLFLPTLTAIYVFFHETGHNFGSYHDPDTPECAPKNKDGGKFIMWSLAVSGDSPNNERFSNCSLRQIGRRMPAPCFVSRSQMVGFCGNGLVDAGEDCDVGARGINDLDNCCDKSCYFRDSAECSDINDECCKECRIAPANTVCRDIPYLYSCSHKSYCTGQSSVCPVSKTLPDGETCGPAHVCFNGRCLNPCMNATVASTEGYLFLPCSCSTPEDMCKYCCMNTTDTAHPGECQVFSTHPKPDGSLCEGGRCQTGRCHRYNHHNQILLNRYIQFVQHSSFEKFTRRNIVVVVIVLSLLVWVPPSLLINRVDTREMEQLERVNNISSIHTQLAALRAKYSHLGLEASAQDTPTTSSHTIRFASQIVTSPVDWGSLQSGSPDVEGMQFYSPTVNQEYINTE